MRTFLFLLLIITIFPVSNSLAGLGLGNPFYFANETDHGSRANYSFFDLRDRESFVQITNVESSNITVHVQIFNVGNLCNENDFFDTYTPNDTHVYNIRDILTNNGNPSGVDLPDDAYGIIFVSYVAQGGMLSVSFAPIIGNFRVIDNSGYEYRTNSQSIIVGPIQFIPFGLPAPSTFFNYNSEDGVILSDIIGVPVHYEGEIFFSSEAVIADPVSTFSAVDVDIINNNEVLFSCRDVVFACIDENSPLQEEVLASANGDMPDIQARSSASVARFEYGINDAIPHSKGGELLCPGNNINEGIVKLTLENFGDEFPRLAGYVGLNNGNSRGSMDSLFFENLELTTIPPPPG